MKVSVKVPATSANLGPGFDTMGMAFPLYNTVTIEETVMPGSGVLIELVSDFDYKDKALLEHIPVDENSIIYKAVELLYNSIGQTPAELKITVESKIPMTRGLGSSSSVIVGALIAANELLGRPADEAALLSIAAEIEGHPDNVAPAILGGALFASVQEDGSVIYKKLPWPEEWKVTACVPDFELSTEIARSVLPKEVPMKDAIFNAQRTAMFVDAIHTKDSAMMKLALHDRLHQPYRMKLMPGLDKIMEQLKYEENVLGCVISGAGSTILLITQNNGAEKAKSIVKNIWHEQNVKVDMYDFSIDTNGAQIIG
ncbi:MAG: homoserine kinase [Fusobacterium sp.]|nr:homoserine kinase [Fusobacterium sp.]